MSSKHTPGPWRLEPNAVYVGGTFVGTDDADVCEMADWGLAFETEQTANARLIAAAPDLLAAAMATVARWDTPKWKDAGPTGAVIGELRAAIARATGAA